MFNSLFTFGRRPVPRRFAPAMLAAAISITLFAIAAPASAQQQAPPDIPAASSSGPSDFILGAPRGWLALRGSYLFPRAGGDLFSFVSDQLTVDRSDLQAGGFAVDVGAALASDIDLVFGFDISHHTTPSEYRRFVTPSRQPIAQNTTLRQSEASAGVRLMPLGRGRRISRFAFIPRRFTPYVGGGASLMYYSLEQLGQFVDFNDLSIFNDRFASNGWTVGPYVNGGADVQVWKRLYVTAEGRYSWLHSGLDQDFSGFDGIDLAGFRASYGISVVF
jgi:opacity protein-like surface antigen